MERLYHHSMNMLETMVLMCQYGSKKSQMTGEGNAFMAPSPGVSVPGESSRSSSFDEHHD